MPCESYTHHALCISVQTVELGGGHVTGLWSYAEGEGKESVAVRFCLCTEGGGGFGF